MTYKNFWWSLPDGSRFYVRVSNNKVFSLGNGKVFENYYELGNKDDHPWGVIIGELFTNDDSS